MECATLSVLLMVHFRGIPEVGEKWHITKTLLN